LGTKEQNKEKRKTKKAPLLTAGRVFHMAWERERAKRAKGTGGVRAARKRLKDARKKCCEKKNRDVDAGLREKLLPSPQIQRGKRQLQSEKKHFKKESKQSDKGSSKRRKLPSVYRGAEDNDKEEV